MSLGQGAGWEFDGLLKDHVHEQEQGLGLHHQDGHLLMVGGVEMLVHAGGLDDRGVARLVIEPPAVMHVVALAREDVKHRRVHVAVLLAADPGAEAIDVAFDGLGDLHVLGVDDHLVEIGGPAMPIGGGTGNHPGLGVEALVNLSIGTFQRPDEDALLLPAVPDRLVVAGGGALIFLGVGVLAHGPAPKSITPQVIAPTPRSGKGAGRRQAQRLSGGR